MTQLLGYHVNAWTGPARDSLRRTWPRVLKVLNTAADVGLLQEWRSHRPDGLLVYRHVFPDGTDDGAVDYRCGELLRSVTPILDLDPIVETPWNECQQDDGLLAPYSDRTCQAIGYLKARGVRRVSVGHFGVQWPHPWAVSYFLPALRLGDFFSLHEYSAPRLQANVGTNCLHYRSLYAALPADCRKPLIISECGIDWGVLGRALSGWRASPTTSPADYETQLRWYALDCARDPYVAGLADFCCGCFPDWRTFDVAGVAEIERAVVADYPQGSIPAPAPETGGGKVYPFELGFKAFHDAHPDLVGEAVEPHHYDADGNDHQYTTRGELVWIKAANLVHFYPCWPSCDPK